MSSRLQKLTTGIGLLALSAGICVGQPAQANDLERFLNGLQGYGPGYSRYDNGYGYGYGDANRLVNRISNRLERGRSNGSLSRREYNRLRMNLNAIMADRPAMDFPTYRSRLLTLDSRITSEMNDSEFAGRWHGYWY